MQRWDVFVASTKVVVGTQLDFVPSMHAEGDPVPLPKKGDPLRLQYVDNARSSGEVVEELQGGNIVANLGRDGLWELTPSTSSPSIRIAMPVLPYNAIRPSEA